ncbi:5'-deoxynucleotidase [Succinimonas amylolytica]|uniref:5'-deoxynucleotidase n=1 Tax=Succinimonas amylolytica TaxID=83769 RepID=UPI0003A8792C|nr:5'-deoxynucleotidase [Succinimonas amylolytica]
MLSDTKQSTFMAWFTRMPLIKRWALMHSVKSENVAEHSYQVAVIAHLLAIISNEYYGSCYIPEMAATIALFHDISETKLQDLNARTKYQTIEFAKQFKKLEHLAERECLNTLPQDLKPHYRNLIVQREVNPVYKPLVKAADTLAAYMKAKDELNNNNREFTHVVETFEKKIQKMALVVPAVNYFMEHFSECCACTIDELSGIDAEKAIASSEFNDEEDELSED